ncbi:acetyl-CoA C-acyltransferase [Aeromonas sp. CU5]|uniref:acetyl-CoA C-acetyltransferase n=1 Tax=Aeromonas sp. CU5 TaxID=2033033 RepID=UPI000BFE1CFB|nr:acetyl-CoA C-acetyltransferase [Aeromonas sp. CU5]ATL91578.1 acetyl-CoA C-acyltransferase [Aeromonas sp. CU5]
MREVYVIDAMRTAIGSFRGGLSAIPAVKLGAEVIKAILKSSKAPIEAVDEVIIGQVLSSGCGQNPARQTAMLSGLSESTTAMTINKVCGSGLKSIQLGYQAILSGDANILIAGGQENMSLAPHLLPYSRQGKKMGEWGLVDSMIKDGLWDAFNDYHMGNTAENVAHLYNISREEQDMYAYQSQFKTSIAIERGTFINEIVPIDVGDKDGSKFSIDEFPRKKTSLVNLGKLKPAFQSDGTVTAGNSSGVNDGAAMIMLASAEAVKKYNLIPMAKIVAFASAGVSPDLMGTGPIYASKKVLDKSGWSIDSLDLVESNEAFAAQAIAVNKEMKWDVNNVNVNGGAISLGHPIGASGARIFVSLLHEMRRRNAKKGLATLCIGGGMGIAATVEKL